MNKNILEIGQELKTKSIVSSDTVHVYEKSLLSHETTNILLIKEGNERHILVANSGSLYKEMVGKEIEEEVKLCPLTHENRLVINQYFPFTKPQAFGREIATFGLGDRLGIASPGHIDIIKEHHVKPILAQQSIRELTLTNRSMTDMLDAAAFAVFQEGYQGGYGADGDHIKTEEEIQMALELGISMLTLDCSDQIKKEFESANESEINRAFDDLPKETKDYYLNTYINKQYDLENTNILFDENSLKRYVLIYKEAIDYMILVYKKYIETLDRPFDFEISIDETETITSPEEHFFVANELTAAGVIVNSLAPRFCGEFQKGIDYIGDLAQFETEIEVHAAIARYFGYKLSIHSGSDKFSVFPIIAKYTRGVLHVKTAGTNWLEAVRVIAKHDPDLYRDMHRYALENVDEALQYYHITPDFDAIKPLDEVSDELLPEYMNDDNARQLLHITYGLLLTAKTDDGEELFKQRFYETMFEFEEEYRKSLANHIGKHLDLLNL